MMTTDPILYWNDVSLEANRVSHTNGKSEQTGPPLSARALAIVHLAMYEAYAGASNYPADLPSYLGLTAPGGAPFGQLEIEAAVAAAAHATLSHLFPSQKAFFDSKHAEAGLSGGGLQQGHLFGLMIAQKMIDDRKNDPGVSDDGYAASMARGAHRVDPDNPDQGYHAPFYGAKSKCFAVTVRHELAAPPSLTSGEYLSALQEVRGKGIAPELMGTLPASVTPRIADETLTGLYWAYDGAAELGTPPRLYNQIIREIAMKKGNTVTQNARLFAFVNAAMADAGILAWDQKYIHDFWRPVVGIREHDASMGPAVNTGINKIDADCDPGWLPLGAPSTNSMSKGKEFMPTYPIYPCGHAITGMVKNFTPPFPAYPSGHATFGAAALHITRLFYDIDSGDRDPDNLFDDLTFVSEELNGKNKDNKGTVRPKHTRAFPQGLWQMIEENGRSRVYLGVHWIFDAFAVDEDNHPDLERMVGGKKIGGVPLGLLIAEDIFSANGGKAPKKSSVTPRM
jgi:membrane-associated phospholipid phosphatase